jgi:rifampicin phosphotransferase
MTMPEAATPAADFPVAWDDPTEAELTWERDDMHMPHVVAPLTVDYISVIAHGNAYSAARFEAPLEFLGRVWNGYAYFAMRRAWPEDEAAREAGRAALTERYRQHIREVRAYWDGRAVPELRRIRQWFRSVRVDELPADKLAEAWNIAWRLAERGWSIHFYAITGPYQVMDDLADLYESVFPAAPSGEAPRLIQGGIDELQSVERGLERLTALAAAEPAIAERLLRDDRPTLADLEAEPTAGPFVAEFRRFLDEHGHLGGSFDDLAFPSWNEEPGMLLADLGRRLRHPGPSADERRAELAADAAALADGMRAKLADDPERLARFEELLAYARDVGPLTEVHNYWIDRLIQSCLRGFVMRVGARLVSTGVLGVPTDILFLRRTDVPTLVRRPADRQAFVAERRAEHARQAMITPPRHVGKPPEEGAAGDRFDGARFQPTEDGTLRGTGASAGIARGTARIVLGPADFGRVAAGDIVVAPSSNPSWVPLFGIAGGLLTDTGGVLSHAAVVAREFALPAVVGLGDATTRIIEGATVELDGTTGLVRLL